MKTREELQSLSLNELKKVHESLVQCLQILNSDNESMCDLSNQGKEMTLNLELTKVVVYSCIIERIKDENYILLKK